MNHLDLEERIKINEYVNEGKTNREIGRILGRSHTTISREIQRNSVKYIYIPHKAHSLASLRIHTPRITPKILTNQPLQDFVLHSLSELRSSPAIIAQELKCKGIPLAGYASHETIYRWIYDLFPDHTQYLLTHRKKRKPRHRKPIHTRISHRTSIHVRPQSINDRTVSGHWESDTVEFSRKTGYLSVQIERSTGFVSIKKNCEQIFCSYSFCS